MTKHIKSGPQVEGFFDSNSNTVSYVVSDLNTERCAIIDSVMDFDLAAGRITTESADKLLAYVRDNALEVEWILETHVHADHLSAAPYLQKQTGAKIGIGAGISNVQDAFGKIFNVESAFQSDASQFDVLLQEGDKICIGETTVSILHTPGHTPACITYVAGDAAFVGDTLFMPDFGTARTDFPGGDAATLYKSIRKILNLDPNTRLFMCHDYKAKGRDAFCWETTVIEQRKFNVHIHEDVTLEQFVGFREGRDKELAMPKLLLPSVQVNMRAGELPQQESNGVNYLKIPINQF